MLRFVGPTAQFEIEAEPQLTLLAHAQLDEWFLGSRCGGHGECGGDRVQILGAQGNLSPITTAEREHLTREELAQGWRLACQCWPEQTSLVLEVKCPLLSHDLPHD